MSGALAASAAASEGRDAGLSAEEPWPGLGAFGEQDAAYFAAREAERDELLERVIQHRLTVLHGLSGKTSLVQAGLFPALRTQQFLPVLVRLNFAADAQSLVDQVLAAIRGAAECAHARASPYRPGESLWEYFHRQDSEFWSSRNRLLTPVLVFDQFEQTFTLGALRRAEECAAFVRALADLAEGRVPESVKARLDRSPPEALRAYNFSRPNRVDVEKRNSPWAARVRIAASQHLAGCSIRFRNIRGSPYAKSV
jgi:hypothetical protein